MNQVSTRGQQAALSTCKIQPARLDLLLTQRLADSFPSGDDWRAVHAHTFIADRGDRVFSDWSSATALKQVGGVYAVLLPVAWFDQPRTMPLHAPHTHSEAFITFEFTLSVLADGYGVIYVGRTTDLQRRFKQHLSNGKRKDGGQVKFGLLDCAIHADSLDALRALREHGRFCYTELPGPENCANRDVLEMALCARFGPPFNIKSER
jgi:GIY-YIG catalytic domain-containing protein